jgi:hypothetical protein
MDRLFRFVHTSMLIHLPIHGLLNSPGRIGYLSYGIWLFLHARMEKQWLENPSRNLFGEMNPYVCGCPSNLGGVGASERRAETVHPFDPLMICKM